eukprot:gene13118-15490_t
MGTSTIMMQMILRIKIMDTCVTPHKKSMDTRAISHVKSKRRRSDFSEKNKKRFKGGFRLLVVPAGGEGPGDQNVTRPGDVEKVRYVLKNILRDWSEEGAFEREQCYNPLIEELERLLPVDVTSPSTCSPTVMVPGAGLGRLCVEIASRGYSAQ